jgi:hypothetical protein
MGWIMADFYVDSVSGNDADDGSTMALAFATLEYAITTGGLSAGDTVWVRRLHDETPANSVTWGYTGTSPLPIKVIGWPRASDTTITSASWTNGSKTVDLVVGLSMDREQHVARYITAPDGDKYMIAVIDDSNTFRLIREYAGPTVTGASGACTIDADTDFDTRPTDTASWDDDADDLAKFGFDTGAFYISHTNRGHIEYKNMWFIDSANGSGVVYVASNSHVYLEGCIVENSKNNRVAISTYLAELTLKRCYLDRTSGNVSVSTLLNNGAVVRLTDCAFYSSDGYSLYLSSSSAVTYLDNVWFDILGDSPNDDIFNTYGGQIFARDTVFTANITEVERNTAMSNWLLYSENHNQALGAHKVWNALGTLTKIDVVEGSGDPYKRTGGGDSVIEILYDVASAGHTLATAAEQYMLEPLQAVIDHEFEATVDRRKYRYYVQAEGAVTAAQLWMEVEYISEYGDSTTEYITTRLTSDEAITVRTDASDWSQYIEVPNVTPAVASKVRVKIYCSYYHATNKIYIDPLPEVTV